MSAPQINAILTKQAVNCGDHGQDITTAVAPAEGETVQEFAERLLVETSRWSDQGVQEDWYVVLRLVRPPDSPKPGTVEESF